MNSRTPKRHGRAQNAAPVPALLPGMRCPGAEPYFQHPATTPKHNRVISLQLSCPHYSNVPDVAIHFPSCPIALLKKASSLNLVRCWCLLPMVKYIHRACTAHAGSCPESSLILTGCVINDLPLQQDCQNVSPICATWAPAKKLLSCQDMPHALAHPHPDRPWQTASATAAGLCAMPTTKPAA